MKKHLVILKFLTEESFGQYYQWIKSGQLIICTAAPLPENSAVLIRMLLPGIDDGILINCRVLSKAAAGGRCRLSLEITDNRMLVMAEIDDLLRLREAYRDMPGLSLFDARSEAPAGTTRNENDIAALEMDAAPKSSAAPAGECLKPEQAASAEEDALSLDWLRQAFDDESAAPVPEAESDLPDEACPEKTELTEDEKKRCQPVGGFIMNLTKAMLRAGYYDPGHPGAATAKSGLYEEFIRVLRESGEIMISNRSSKEKEDLLVTGILDEPVSIHQMVTPGVAGLFVPKLCEYCEKKELVAFAIRKEIPASQFDDFITIMSDPQVDRGERHKAGTYLTNALVEHGITSISTVFADDLLELEQDLPWRVEMAIQRLAKDFRLMPMFAGASEDAVKKMKLATVEDIIRPLKHPQYLNDFLVNSYIIAENVGQMDPEVIEEIIVDAFPVEKLLPTSKFTFRELADLNQLNSQQPDKAIILKRLSGIKRILKQISRRVILEEAPGAQIFLEQLYENEILTFEELPADVKLILNTKSIAGDFEKNSRIHAARLEALKTPEDARVYLKTFSRIVPFFRAAGKWDVLSNMVDTLARAAECNQVFSRQLNEGLMLTGKTGIQPGQARNSTEMVSAFLFCGIQDQLGDSFQQADAQGRMKMSGLLDRLGMAGVDILSRVLARSTDREVRKSVVEALQAKGDTAREWALKIIEDKSHEWFMHRNAMMILRSVSRQEADFEAVRKFLKSSHSRLREEAMGLVLSLRPGDTESLIIDALADADPRVRWRALKALADIPSVHESTMDDLLGLISRLFQQQEPAEDQVRSMVQFMSAISAMKHIPSGEKVEAVVLEIVKTAAQRNSGWRKLLKKATGQNRDASILNAGIPLLGRIGGDLSRKVLAGLLKSHSSLADAIHAAMGRIEKRL